MIILPKKSISHPFVSLMLLLLLGFVWGTGYSIARFAMTNGVPPLGYSFWQSLGPAILISLLLLSQRKQVAIQLTGNLTYFSICGLTGIVIPNTTMYFAASHLPAGILAMVVNTVPIIAYPLALLAGLEVFNWQRMLGIGLAFVGLLFIIIPKTSLPSPDLAPWVLITLITPFSFAICSIFIARYRPAANSGLLGSAGMLLFSSILLTPLVIVTDSFYFFHWPLTAPDWIIFLEILLSSLGYILFFKLIKIAGPVYYSLVDTIVVLTGLFWGTVLFQEHLNKWTTAAVIFILGALLMVIRQQRQAVAIENLQTIT